MTVLKGADVVGQMKEELTAALAALRVTPRLAIVRVGERADDLAYERGAIKRLSGLGLQASVFAYPADISQEDFLAAFRRINDDPAIHGILVFRPLPGQIDDGAVIAAIAPGKDVDGISPVNMAKVYAGDPAGFAPCTAAAVMAMLDYGKVELKGRRVTVVGRSLVVGKPLAMLLLGRHATVTVCHSRTADLPAACRQAEVLAACVGKAKMLGKEHIAPGGTVIDVGINVDADGSLCGDVDYAAVADIAGLITPVPGGVGAVTTAILARHVIRAAAGAQAGAQDLR
ncbi:MAG: bifunctional 5,10-methylene-tetrahydrofolate dehydrogenase/5,10-methylene-tetrahydrofolate cyclohydrolase [Peptococcaceae bacterium]|jgi:methylenetetrahydrofolate dehydrogenase (NADP+)/methenyltetrahydrofolate cyclohydrolase|nr:bifunctional 5,10-methylene-tetrahydrofolate dehydrogenase/5,10-methylene-tetrahydrofolate cyclohydrolase [Peptococcaceae bacterium]